MIIVWGFVVAIVSMILFMTLSFTVALVLCMLVVLAVIFFAMPKDAYIFGFGILYPIVIFGFVILWFLHFLVTHLHFY